MGKFADTATADHVITDENRLRMPCALVIVKNVQNFNALTTQPVVRSNQACLGAGAGIRHLFPCDYILCRGTTGVTTTMTCIGAWLNCTCSDPAGGLVLTTATPLYIMPRRSQAYACALVARCMRVEPRHDNRCMA